MVSIAADITIPGIRRPARGKQKRLISYDNSAIGKYRIIIGVGL